MVERLGLLEADDDALAGVLLELKEASSKTGDERLARWRAAGAAFRRKDADRKAAPARAGNGVAQSDCGCSASLTPNAAAIPGAKSSSAASSSRPASPSEEPAVILGLLAAAKRVLSGEHAADSRQRWKDLGDQAFSSGVISSCPPPSIRCSCCCVVFVLGSAFFKSELFGHFLLLAFAIALMVVINHYTELYVWGLAYQARSPGCATFSPAAPSPSPRSLRP